MAPRPPQAARKDILKKTIKKPKLSSTPISEVFLEACEKKDYEKIRACLTLGVDINCRGSDNHSALYKSLRYSYEKVFEILIELPDVDVDQINEEQILPLACRRGQEDKLRKLCELPEIDVNAGYPLCQAIMYHNVAAINILAENPALDWNGGEYMFRSPIVKALERGYADIVEIFLTQPTLNLSRTNFDGRSVGHSAVEYSFTKEYYPERLNVSAFPVKCVELLSKDSRVNWNVRNKAGETPMMIALKNKEKEMVKILLKTPGVDLSDVTRLSEGQAILKEMLQEADMENRKLPSKVPNCPVSV